MSLSQIIMSNSTQHYHGTASSTIGSGFINIEEFLFRANN